MSLTVIGLDIGTSSSKAVLFHQGHQFRQGNQQGNIIAKASSKPYQLNTHQGGATQQALEVWQGAKDALRQLLKNNPHNAQEVDAPKVDAIALSGAMHSLLPLDADYQPLAPALTWADSRPAAMLPTLREEIADIADLYARTGCPLQTPYHLARLRWLQQHHHNLAIAKIAALKDWVFWQLTGELVTDVGMASTTGLLNIHTLEWDDIALEHAHVSPADLPQLVAPTYHAPLRTDLANELGIPCVPVICGGSDGVLANVGSSAALPGSAAITVGTSGAVRLTSNEPLLDVPRGRTWSYLLTPGQYVSGGAINNGGIALQYLQNNLFAELSTASLIGEASQVGLKDARPLVLPYFSGERSPHWRSDAVGTIHGLTLEHSRAALVRSVLEAVCFCLADIWQILDPKTDTDTIFLSGGICQSRFWSQMLADVLGTQVVLVDAADASALGAAMLGAMALGEGTLEHLSQALARGDTLPPDEHAHAHYQTRLAEFRDLFATLYPH